MTERRWLEGISVGLVIAASLSYWGYVKDDAYISFRYARNLLHGHGLSFNPGVPLEGYTNFLWTMLSVPVQAVGASPLVAAKVLGLASALGTLFLMRRLARNIDLDETFLVIPALGWATSTSVALWSMSGLEPVFVAFLWTGALTFSLAQATRNNLALSAMFCVAACLTRPEGHGLVFLLGLLFLVETVLKNRRWVDLIGWSAAILSILIPYHGWRRWYFGSWVPNTFRVKGSGGLDAIEAGLARIDDLLLFQGWGLWIALALLAPLLARGVVQRRIWFAGFVCFWLFYQIKIGRDEMKYFRLFLPALPAILVFAQATVTGFWERYSQTSNARVWVQRAVWTVVLILGGTNLMFTVTHRRDNHYVRWSQESFQELGRYMQERSQPGAVCVFQDMGGAPWAAPDIHFIDTIGILNDALARDLASIHLNPFLRSGRTKTKAGREEVEALDARARDQFLEPNPRWIAFVAYIPRGEKRSAFNEDVAPLAMDSEQMKEALYPYVVRNSHGHGLAADPRFKQHYAFVRAWRRNAGYWLVLYERMVESESGSGQ